MDCLLGLLWTAAAGDGAFLLSDFRPGAGEGVVALRRREKIKAQSRSMPIRLVSMNSAYGNSSIRQLQPGELSRREDAVGRVHWNSWQCCI